MRVDLQQIKLWASDRLVITYADGERQRLPELVEDGTSIHASAVWKQGRSFGIMRTHLKRLRKGCKKVVLVARAPEALVALVQR